MATEVVSQLVDEYKTLANKSIDNAKTFANNLPQKVEEAKTTCQNLQPTVTDYATNLTSDIQRFVQEMSPPGEDAGLYKNLLENYLWVSVCLLASSVVSIVLGAVVGVILGTFLTAGAAALISLVGIPFAVVNYIPTLEGSEEDRRLALLAAIVADGLVLALTLVGSRMTFYAPPTFLLAAGIALLSAGVGPSVGSQPRHVFLGVAVGGPCALNLLYGMMMGSLNGAYFMWMLILGGAAAIDLQVKIGRFKEGQTATALHQGISAMTLLLTAFSMTYFFSSNSNEWAPTAEAVH